jgi:hypothetical protein
LILVGICALVVILTVAAIIAQRFQQTNPRVPPLTIGDVLTVLRDLPAHVRRLPPPKRFLFFAVIAVILAPVVIASLVPS